MGDTIPGATTSASMNNTAAPTTVVSVDDHWTSDFCSHSNWITVTTTSFPVFKALRWVLSKHAASPSEPITMERSPRDRDTKTEAIEREYMGGLSF